MNLIAIFVLCLFNMLLKYKCKNIVKTTPPYFIIKRFLKYKTTSLNIKNCNSPPISC